jgi:hypothetical protein
MWLQARRCLLREMQAERKGGGGGGECAGCSSHEYFHAMVAVVGHDSAAVAADGDAAAGTVEELPAA